jgi:hypothetical protein
VKIFGAKHYNDYEQLVAGSSTMNESNDEASAIAPWVLVV